MLYLVPTPIGNLKDITIRAIDTLQDADLILAEDTRVTGKLLKHYGIDTPTKAYHAHNEHKTTSKIIESLLQGKTIALVTDAGTPAISDPGFLLVKACHEQDIVVVPLPGPTALIAGIAASGLPSDKFHFEGFLPAKKGRNKRLAFLSSYPYSIVLYESPYRLLKTLKDIEEIYENSRRVCIAKEISKIHESFVIDLPKVLIDRLESIGPIKGEYVLIIEPWNK
jgi:16S rRNA (cytidine1402-2'-O)-methyltransferase